MKKLILILVTVLLVACSSGGKDTNGKSNTYTGVGKGFDGDITVEVTVDESDKITKVEVKEHGESVDEIAEVKTAIEEVPKQIVDKGSADVDEVAGATYTSDGIKEAVEDALSKAK